MNRSEKVPYSSRHFAFIAVTALALLCGATTDMADAQRYIVRFRSTGPSSLNVSALGETGVASALGTKPVRLLRLDNSAVVSGDSALLGELKKRTDVESIELDTKVHAYLTPDDPELSNQYGLVGTYGIHAPKAWDVTTGSRDVVVGIVDTGTDYGHSDIAQNMWTNTGEIPGNGIDDDGDGYVDDYYGYDFNGDDGDPMDDNEHGTHVSGIVSAVGNNGAGVSGVSFTSTIMSIKVLDQDGSGYMSSIAAGVEYAITQKDRGVNIVALNMSLGGEDAAQVLYRAIERAMTRGILVMAAAGNDGLDNNSAPSYPANFKLPNIISVAATTAGGDLASFSNYGSTTVHIGAPGTRIKSTVPRFLSPADPYELLSGTSMATPHVTGAAALVASANPSLTSSQIRTILLGTARPLAALEGKTVTGGLLDVQAAVNQAIGTQAAYTVYGYVLKHLKGVRGVRVTVVSSDKSFKETTKTASDGAYRFDDLPAGSYTLSAQKTSTHFKKARYLLTVLTNQRQNFQVKP